MKTIEELAYWFESAAIAYGYAHDTFRSELADSILVDLEKIVAQSKSFGPVGEEKLAGLMTVGSRPWVRYCAAMLMMQIDRSRAISSLKQLTSEQGMFVPMCIALLADTERNLGH